MSVTSDPDDPTQVTRRIPAASERTIPVSENPTRLLKAPVTS